MPLSTLNRRQSCARQQCQRHLLLQLLVTVLALVGLVAAAPAKRNTSPYSFNVTLALQQASSTWMSPCGRNGQGNVGLSHDASFNKSTKYFYMERQINLTLLDLENWRELAGSNKSVTTWNDNDRKRQFKFLQPFVKNESSWERRLSVYWAYLKLVRLFHEKYPETTNIDRYQANALESVNEANRQLLCMVQEYRAVTKLQKKLIDAEHMERMIKFNIQDAGEIEIHIWNVMCRLECFLRNMRKHLRQLSGKRNRPHKKINLLSCKACPYCSNANKQCKPSKKKHRKQPKQQQQPRQHNRADHRAQQKQQSKQQQQQKQQQKQQQQQPSRQPKGQR
uniref:Uncharacterized protein n=1 Tax=Anopheles maculatus TaxID=74869 RepID=A0A182SWU4_9DIPT